jgi:hypothetical protein
MVHSQIYFRSTILGFQVPVLVGNIGNMPRLDVWYQRDFSYYSNTVFNPDPMLAPCPLPTPTSYMSAGQAGNDQGVPGVCDTTAMFAIAEGLADGWAPSLVGTVYRLMALGPDLNPSLSAELIDYNGKIASHSTSSTTSADLSMATATATSISSMSSTGSSAASTRRRRN